MFECAGVLKLPILVLVWVMVGRELRVAASECIFNEVASRFTGVSRLSLTVIQLAGS